MPQIMSQKSLGLEPSLYDYLLAANPPEPDILRQLREETARLPQAMMQITPEQGSFMALLANLIQARHVLEIGVFTGYSSLAVLLAMPETGRLTACDISDEWTAIAQRYWHKAGMDGKAELRLGPALATLDILLEEDRADTFDMAFIDADKENYVEYYERSLHLVRPGGLILIDNLLWGGKVADPSVQDKDTCSIRELNQLLRTDERILFSLLPIADGLGIAVRRAS